MRFFLSLMPHPFRNNRFVFNLTCPVSCCSEEEGEPQTKPNGRLQNGEKVVGVLELQAGTLAVEVYC